MVTHAEAGSLLRRQLGPEKVSIANESDQAT